jgi:hypothetical protein
MADPPPEPNLDLACGGDSEQRQGTLLIVTEVEELGQLRDLEEAMKILVDPAKHHPAIRPPNFLSELDEHTESLCGEDLDFGEVGRAFGNIF